MDQCFSVVASRVGYGKCTVNDLGFPPNQIVSRHPSGGWTPVGAHAPSTVTIELRQPCEVMGILNWSADLAPDRPTEFWVDYNYLGRIWGPCQETASVVLPAGQHVFTVRLLSQDRTTRHTVWMLRPVESATDAKTAVVTISNYNGDQAYSAIRRLAYSARKHGVWLHVFGVDEERYRGWYNLKVKKLREWIASLPNHYTRVIYMDGVDTFWTCPLSEAERKFAEFDKPLVLGAEAGGGFPVSAVPWTDQYPQQVANRKFMNAGCFMGERTAIESALAILDDVHTLLGREAPDPSLVGPKGEEGSPRVPWAHRWARDDDQFLWQLCQLQQRFPFVLDTTFRIFANLYAERPESLGQPFEFRGDRMIDHRGGGETPCVLHFSGGAHSWVDQWAGRLGSCDA